MDASRFLTRLVLATVGTTTLVVVLGAYVRLTDAGLGCPDWPGCYGYLVAPDPGETSALAAKYARPLETAKAWKEMIHRYAAGFLGLMILLIAALSWHQRKVTGRPLKVPLLLLGLVIVQAALGMWTVTLLLKPLVVVLHLVGGFSVLAALWWLTLDLHGVTRLSIGSSQGKTLRRWALLGLGLLVVQIALGGWTSRNYAALACPDFPTCHGKWWPNSDFSEGVVLWRGLGQDYEGGVLEGSARVAINLAHRLGALVTFLYVAALAFRLARMGKMPALAASMFGLLIVQVSLGVSNVLLGLPLAVAVAHNAIAAALLLTLITAIYRLWSSARSHKVGQLKCG